MGMKNHPVDTRSKRIMAKKPARARDWLVRGTNRTTHPTLEALFTELEIAGVTAIHIGELLPDDGEGERLESVILTMPARHGRQAKAIACITAFEQKLGVEDPGTGIGNIYAVCRCR